MSNDDFVHGRPARVVHDGLAMGEEVSHVDLYRRIATLEERITGHRELSEAATHSIIRSIEGLSSRVEANAVTLAELKRAREYELGQKALKASFITFLAGGTGALISWGLRHLP